MRSLAYVIACLAAVGIVVGIAMMPVESESKPGVLSASTPSTSRVATEAGTLVMRVPEMHCPFACYPAVKSTLESDATVTSVELTPQKEEGAIDNPEVVVHYQAGFNIDSAIAALANKHFAGSTVVE